MGILERLHKNPACVKFIYLLVLRHHFTAMSTDVLLVATAEIVTSPACYKKKL
jgi:hypothetical protein